MVEHAQPRETVLSVDVQRLAKVYAEASLNAAGEPSAQEALVAEFAELEKNLLDKYPQLETLFDSELIPAEEKLALLDKIFGQEASATLLNTLRVMVKHDRLGLVRGVARSIHDLWEARSSRVRIHVETAQPLDAQLQQEIVDAFRKLLGAEPTLVARINPDVLAGFVVRVGDRVYDASARSGLARLGKQMLDRAVEAIQSNPHRFLEGAPNA